MDIQAQLTALQAKGHRPPAGAWKAFYGSWPSAEQILSTPPQQQHIWQLGRLADFICPYAAVLFFCFFVKEKPSHATANCANESNTSLFFPFKKKKKPYMSTSNTSRKIKETCMIAG